MNYDLGQLIGKVEVRCQGRGNDDIRRQILAREHLRILFNEAQKEFLQKTDLIRTEKKYDAVSNQIKYNLNIVAPLRILDVKWNEIPLDYVNYEEMLYKIGEVAPGDGTLPLGGIPRIWSRNGNTLYVFRPPSEAGTENIVADYVSKSPELKTLTDFAFVGKVVNDNFNRSNNNTLGLYWVEKETGATSVRVLNNVLLLDQDTTVYGYAFWNESFPDDQFAEALIDFDVSSANLSRGGPAVRIDSSGSETSATMYMADIDQPSDKIILRVYSAQDLNTAGTSLGEYATLPTNGDKIRIEAEGSIIRVYVGTTKVIEVFDNSITSGYPGMVGRSATATDGQAWDDFKGGGLPERNIYTDYRQYALKLTHYVNWQCLQALGDREWKDEMGLWFQAIGEVGNLERHGGKRTMAYKEIM